MGKSQLNISHLKMICTIVESNTVKEAAEKLFITQPALTNRIREAERRLNINLFARRRRKLVITTAGKRLLQSAKKILEELERAEYDIARLSDGIDQVLRIGLPHYASFKWLPDVVSYFHKELSNIELEITAEASISPLDALYNGDVDIALISSKDKLLDIHNNDYDTVFIFQDELQACLSTKHKKAQQPFMSAEDFSNETYITNSTVPEKDREYELLFKPQNVLPYKVVQVGFNEAIIELVKVNMGVTIMSKQLIVPYLTEGEIKTMPIGESGLKIYWHLVYLKTSNVIKPAKLMTNILKKHANK
ncbi:LysR family transcriptional regulator [Colwellia sp. MB3u-70]|uniref:LysR family transcriptional regulator n=1 Tax=unclassified Colwellia TaxID=196834 RepID=UPI0015F6288E|nr:MULTISPECIES: LysR family transcriptional regulator [unclassified Colwellia]MBA6291007.1 LysR family transcriptional regulator [Colwellia sp. MB3u-8]MBA6308274.1 LysR family transcriptional regulator [Colwellia sp. MB3u-70]